MRNFNFIAAGEILNTEMEKNEVKAIVQEYLDFIFDGDVLFDYEPLNTSKIRLIFWRNIEEYDPSENVISDRDMCIVSGMNISAFQLTLLTSVLDKNIGIKIG